MRGLLLSAFMLLSVAVSGPLRGAENCMDCHHSGMDKDAPIISVLGGSVHEGLSCKECHPGDEIPPCPPGLPPVKCSTCHKDSTGELGRSTHGRKMLGYLKDEKEGVQLRDLCMSCHGPDVHHMKSPENALSPTNRMNVYKTCLDCHSEVQPIAIEEYVDSIHGVAASAGELRSAVCTDCHGVHYIEGVEKPDSKIYHSNIPETCGECHTNEYSEYIQSKHYKTVQSGFREAPVCTDCHGEHGIRSRRDPRSPVWAGNITKTCAGCHESEALNAKFMMPEGMVRSFEDSYHGLSGSLGDVRVANCSSCHGNHSILPPSDPRSTVHPSNLAKTCGACHPGAEKRFINEPIHKVTRAESHWVVGLVRNIYIILILLTIGAMLSHNFLDLVYRSKRGRPYTKEHELEPRMSVNERLQHLVLFLSFFVLAYSGFALRFQDSFIAAPFQWLEFGASFRRWLHRGAAVVFVSLSVYHLFYLAAWTRGRKQLRLIMPRPKDLAELKDVMLKYVRPGRGLPRLGHYSYVEKAEYWALVWGTLIMTGTGFMLWGTDLVLSYMPLWVVDLAATIHFYEAVLAVSAIVVWHFYWVIFNPEVYPMDVTWIYGSEERHDKRDGKAREGGLEPRGPE